MNTEIERKYKITDYEQIKDKLLKLGAKFVSKKESKDTYFVIPQEVKNTRYLRIRSSNEKGGTLAYHEVLNDFETKEFEVEVSDNIATETIFKKLSFMVDVIVEKVREKFNFEDYEIVLDEVTNLGYFIELEATSIDKLESLAKKLELDKNTIISGAGYPDLLRED